MRFNDWFFGYICGLIMGVCLLACMQSCHAEDNSKGYEIIDEPIVQPVVPAYPQGYTVPIYPPPLLYPRPDPVYAPYVQVGPPVNNIPNGIYQYNPNFQHVIIEQRGYYGR